MSKSTPPPPDPETAARLYEQGLADESTGSGDRRPPPLPPEEIQAHFPDLEVEAIVGEGGMGVVYRARQKHLDRLVALKVLPPGLGADPAFAERFGREARALARLDHPHIVRVYDFGQSDGLYYLLMEYVDGASLRDVLAEGRMRPEEALGIVPQICAALQFAHDGGVIHRDVKPENILIDAQGKAKITDFGLAKLLEDGPGDVTLTRTGQVMGTMQYMAPEQYRAPQEVDHRADIFSVGVVFYEMLTGQLPVGHFRPPSHDQDMDRRIDEIVLKALERERELRYQHVGEVSSDVHGLHRSPPRPRVAPSPRQGGGKEGDTGGGVRLLLAAVAVLVGVAAFALVHEAWGAVERGSAGAFQREVAKALAAALFFGVGAFLAIQAAFVAHRTRAGQGRFRLAVALAIVSCLLVPAVMVVAAVEVRTHAVSDAPPSGGAFGSFGGRRSGRTGRAAIQAARGLLDRYAQAVQRHPEGLDQAEALRMYDAASEAQIRAVPAAERGVTGRMGRLGLPLLDPARLEGPPGEFEVDEVRLESGGKTATVTLSRRGGGFFTQVVFPIRYGRRIVGTVDGDVAYGFNGWLFAAGPVEVRHLDRPDEE